jgi:hypothetical protein
MTITRITVALGRYTLITLLALFLVGGLPPGLFETVLMLLGGLWGMFGALPAGVQVIGTLLLLGGAIYREGWNAAVESTYVADLEKAEGMRQARRK